MTAHRRAYLAALVAAILVLIASVTAVTVYVATHTRDASPSAATSRSDGWGGWTSPGTGSGTQSDEGSGWDGAGPMMNDGDGSMNGQGWTMMGGSGKPVTFDQARGIAQDWVDTEAATATLDAGTTTGGGYGFTVTRDGQTFAWLWVDAATGRVGVRTAAPTAPVG